jgi:hypothetical protein
MPMIDVLKVALSAVVIAVFCVWLALTLLNQHRRTRRLANRVLRYDICGLVPIWTFFAPNPGDTDLHLLFRDRDREGRVTGWREVRLVGRRRATDVWNPKRRINKAIVDLVYDLTRPDRGQPAIGAGPRKVSKQRVLSFPYLLILNYVTSLQGDFGAIERQFVIAKTAGMRSRAEPDVLLVSPFHVF